MDIRAFWLWLHILYSIHIFHSVNPFTLVGVVIPIFVDCAEILTPIYPEKMAEFCSYGDHRSAELHGYVH
jgi:hypothetical protein